ncbi:MAG: molybdenum cofactor guanylyltransferase [Halobacteriota archaeon]|nr:molybdenum cofactor guanylyltransferase [Halobacteriota archaeon]
MRSAVILGGGKSSRFNYTDKSFINFERKPLLKHVIESVSGVVDELIIAIQDEDKICDIEKMFDVKVVIDRVKGFGPVAGISAGLKASSTEYSIILACDMPYTNREVISLLFDRAEGYDAAIPKWEDELIEPLYAVYRRESMIKATKNAIEEGKHKVSYPISRLPEINYVPIKVIREIDPELKSFININTPKDLNKLSNNLKKD